MKFKDLSVGETFRFGSEFSMPHSGMKTGLARKTSARGYEYIGDGMKCQVGSVSVEVVRARE